MGTAGTPNLLFVIPKQCGKFQSHNFWEPMPHVLVFSKRIKSIWDSRYTIFETKYASREKSSPYKLFLLIFHLPFPLWLSKQGAMVSSHWFLTIRIFWQPKGGPFFNKDVATISSWTRWFVGGAKMRLLALNFTSITIAHQNLMLVTFGWVFAYTAKINEDEQINHRNDFFPILSLVLFRMKSNEFLHFCWWNLIVGPSRINIIRHLCIIWLLVVYLLISYYLLMTWEDRHVMMAVMMGGFYPRTFVVNSRILRQIHLLAKYHMLGYPIFFCGGLCLYACTQHIYCELHSRGWCLKP